MRNIRFENMRARWAVEALEDGDERWVGNGSVGVGVGDGDDGDGDGDGEM